MSFDLLARQQPVAAPDLRVIVTEHADEQPTSSGWATWPGTWPRSLGCATRSPPCRPSCATNFLQMGQVAERDRRRRPGRRSPARDVEAAHQIEP